VLFEKGNQKTPGKREGLKSPIYPLVGKKKRKGGKAASPCLPRWSEKGKGGEEKKGKEKRPVP